MSLHYLKPFSDEGGLTTDHLTRDHQLRPTDLKYNGPYVKKLIEFVLYYFAMLFWFLLIIFVTCDKLAKSYFVSFY